MAEIGADVRGVAAAPFRSFAFTLLVAVLASLGLYAAFVAGPAMRASAHESALRAIADEDRQFCDHFGMHSGTEAFVACGRELAVIRQRQADRDKAAAEDLL